MPGEVMTCAFVFLILGTTNYVLACIKFTDDF